MSRARASFSHAQARPIQAASTAAIPAAPAHLRHAILAVILLSVSAAGGGMVWAMKRGAVVPALTPGDITHSTDAARELVSDAVAGQLGPSGFPIPRFVTLKAGKVNVRKGPSHEHAIAWVFQRKGLPVEITAESDNWRKIRDSDGSEGWIQQSMLTGKRYALAASWARNKAVLLRATPGEQSPVVVKLAAGVLASVDSCSGTWCYVSADSYEGYARQDELWGVYPGEVVD
jgi:SH3-like domain-containing protein